jgi:hypothetical protein
MAVTMHEKSPAQMSGAFYGFTHGVRVDQLVWT